MRYEWDESKRRANIRKHGLDFVGVEEVFGGKMMTTFDDRFDYGEERFVTVGILSGRVVVVAHTERQEVMRIISVRKATRNEEIAYFKTIAD